MMASLCSSQSNKQTFVRFLFRSYGSSSSSSSDSSQSCQKENWPVFASLHNLYKKDYDVKAGRQNRLVGAFLIDFALVLLVWNKVSWKIRFVVLQFHNSEIVKIKTTVHWKGLGDKKQEPCFSKALRNLECIYKKKKNGKLYSSGGTGGSLEGMPTNSLKHTLKNYKKDIYVNIYISVRKTSYSLTPKSETEEFKPHITGVIKVYDSRKKVIFKNRLTWNNIDQYISKEKKKSFLPPENRIRLINSFTASLLK